jgi:cobalt-zinc-cadmium efflux system membrane fusion protein
MTPFRTFLLSSAVLLVFVAGGCGETAPAGDEHADHAEAADTDYERGPHRGRLLRDGEFSVEVTIFEDGVDPEFHVYAFENGKPLAPSDVQLAIELTRLGPKVDRFAFTPLEDYLLGDGVVREPHSFDVKVTATRDGKTSEWIYKSYEGRTTIEAAQAEAAGVQVEPAGPASIAEMVSLTGRVELQPEGRAEVRAWYPGRIVSMSRSIGDRVEKGQTLATVMSSESLQTYALPAPMSGVIMERGASVGDVAASEPLFIIADPTKLHAEFFIYPRDAERLRAGQPVKVTSVGGHHTFEGEIEVVLPTSDMLTQTVIAHVDLPNPDGVTWRPGQAVEGQVAVAADEVPLAVRTRALQRFRDFTVVYARVGETYEVRMLDLGRQSPEWTEVLGGVEPGEIYVSDNAFLIRADVEKTGASHDH